MFGSAVIIASTCTSSRFFEKHCDELPFSSFISIEEKVSEINLHVHARCGEQPLDR